MSECWYETKKERKLCNYLIGGREKTAQKIEKSDILTVTSKIETLLYTTQ